VPGALLVAGLLLWSVTWWLHGRHVEQYRTEQLEVVEHRELT